jgi:hypothetical protein
MFARQSDQHDAFIIFLPVSEHFADGSAMSKNRKQESAQASNVFQFTLAGLIVFSVALIGASAFLTYRLTLSRSPGLEQAFAVDPKDKSNSVRVGPWGTLLTREIQLERPVEYLTDEVANPQPQVWTFNGMKPDAVKALFLQNGLSAAQAAEALAPGSFGETSSGTELRPREKFLLSLSSEVRQKLYVALAGLGVNLYLDYPYIFPGDVVETIYNDSRLNVQDVALFKQLIYLNGGAHQLSDYQFMLGKIPTVERRVAMARSMSRQSAVLARLVIHPDTDIDKIAGYWGNMRNVHFTDIRPLMESLKQMPQGGNVSLLYVLPKFARDRLYTFPLPPQPGEPTMDCHWSTFNFSNETPDNRFNDPAFAVQYIQKNYYQIAAPSLYGDIVLLMNDKQEVKHSAVYLADDIVFTKNGNNYRQPWMLMRIPDLLATYPSTPPMRVIYMRHKVD